MAKFKFKGKEIEELKQMPLNEFTKFLPARQRRSIKRGFTEQQKKLYEKIKKANQGIYKKQIKTHVRTMIIIPEMVGLTINIHNGKEFIPVNIIGEMLGHYLGEFSQTRKSVAHSAPGVGATKSSAAVSVK